METIQRMLDRWEEFTVEDILKAKRPPPPKKTATPQIEVPKSHVEVPPEGPTSKSSVSSSASPYFWPVMVLGVAIIVGLFVYKRPRS